MMVNHVSADQTTETTTPNVVATNDNKTTFATAQDAVEDHADQAVTTETTEPKEASSEQTSASAHYQSLIYLIRDIHEERQ